MVPLRYVPSHRLAGTPHVIVDGSPTDGTVLVLSHWPHIPSAPGLEADLSAQMALAYLDRPDPHGAAEVVSNNHFDQDGLVSVFALAHPEEALERKVLLADLAAAGDFATYRDRRAARSSMVIAAYADPGRSPLGPAPEDDDEWGALLYAELLGRLPEVVDHVDAYEALWGEEDADLRDSEAMIEAHDVSVDERHDLDLAIVTLPAGPPGRGDHRFGGMWSTGLHPMAVNNATDCLTVLTIRGRHYELCYRYESWVQYRSRRPRPRVDLSGLAEELSGEETEGRWHFDGVESLTPSLHLVGADESAVPAERFVQTVVDHLSSGAPAWDPYVVACAGT